MRYLKLLSNEDIISMLVGIGCPKCLYQDIMRKKDYFQMISGPYPKFECKVNDYELKSSTDVVDNLRYGLAMVDELKKIGLDSAYVQCYIKYWQKKQERLINPTNKELVNIDKMIEKIESYQKENMSEKVV